MPASSLPLFMMVIKGKATSLDIAHMAGVSQPTVSRALRGSPEMHLRNRFPPPQMAMDAVAESMTKIRDQSRTETAAQEPTT